MSEYQFSDELIGNIKSFVTALKGHPDIIQVPQLEFFREYLESLGAKIPKATSKPTNAGDPPTASDHTPNKEPEPMMEDESEEDSEEPYPEFDMEGVVDPADKLDPNQEMGKENQNVSEEDVDKSNEFKREAVGFYAEGKFEECVEKYTEAIKLNSGSALLFAKRGQALIQMGKPNACIRDCNRALEINPDSAVAYKFRGRAHRLLGHWHEAAADLRQACKIDFDEQADEWLKEVTPNARKVEEWEIRKTRHDEEKELKRRKRLQKERMRAHEEAKSAHHGHGHGHGHDDDDDGVEHPSGGGFGGIPGFDKLLSDPEVLQLFSDPEVATAFNDITQNPMNILKHQSNPKVAKLMKILQGKMGGAMGMGGGGGGGGGMPFGMGGIPGGGFGGGFAPPEQENKQDPPPKASTFADDLD